MVFSSLPAYLDPANWQQQPNQHLFHQAAGANQQLITPSPQTTPPPPSAQPHGGGLGSPGSTRPGSMAERARLANIPMPEGPLKCPRCDSSNTKFCYFNNYSLTQPRHFCKSCRRYWTRGGALRSVPVGGGCRRNKRTKSTSSNSNKSPISQAASSSTSTVSSQNTGLIQATHNNANNILNTNLNSPLPMMRFMSPLGQFIDNYNSPSDNIGLNFSGISTPLVGGTSEMNFQMGTNNLLSGGIEQWRLQQQAQQFPFLSGSGGGLDPQSVAGIYPFQLGGSGGGIDPGAGFLGESIHHNNQVRPNEKLSASFLSQLASVKMEDPNNPTSRAGSGSLSLSRQFLGMNNVTTSDHQWNNNTINNNNNNVNTAWTDLSSFSSSSTSNPI
ncbi:hypothetical protein Leryth_018160 [Lithospermum erythrorhizon]|uniref:Dof zinc finger protein n=1 Tax=Lithospermum erythrorhizon TaxID=34254 RepID=A0AAV3PCY0_LITER|nr:hypothetical protein Leryth_018160 [Lithospermum erythrorhizon]